MENMYRLIVGPILLFPWSLVGIMVDGSVWGDVRPSGRVRIAARGEARAHGSVGVVQRFGVTFR
jgi:hypothetical protein